MYLAQHLGNADGTSLEQLQQQSAKSSSRATQFNRNVGSKPTAPQRAGRIRPLVKARPKRSATSGWCNHRWALVLIVQHRSAASVSRDTLRRYTNQVPGPGGQALVKTAVNNKPKLGPRSVPTEGQNSTNVHIVHQVSAKTVSLHILQRSTAGGNRHRSAAKLWRQKQ